MEMVKWCHDNIHPNCKADMSHFRLSVVGMVKQWRSYDDGKSWTITIHGESPVLTIEIADEQLATLFALKWSGVK
jgi:hypothetical protein